jgi:hypothetical protein
MPPGVAPGVCAVQLPIAVANPFISIVTRLCPPQCLQRPALDGRMMWIVAALECCSLTELQQLP